MNWTRRHPGTVLCGLLLISLGVLLCAPSVGMRFISPSQLWAAPPEENAIFWGIRVPRVLTAFLAGMGLAVSGMAFQAMFRNPLATPFTLGVSSGASLGAALYVRFGLPLSILGLSGISLAAFAGALFSLVLVYGLTRLRGGFSGATLLLAGVAVSFFFSSLILFIQYLSGLQHSFQIVRWLMGSLDVTGYRPVVNLLVFVATGTAIILALGHELNLLATGEDLAAARGADVARVRKYVFFSASLMVGGVVAFCGPIGFVGMMSPHICRMVVGSNHRVLAPATLLFGGVFLVGCDVIARTLIAPAEIPVGVITALLGGPFFIWLLLHDRPR